MTPETPEMCPKSIADDIRVKEMIRWLDWLDDNAFGTSTVSFLLAVSPPTVRRWRTGKLVPSEASLQSVRMLVALRKVAPTVARCVRIWSAGELASNLDGLRVRALVPWEVDRAVSRPATDGADL